MHDEIENSAFVIGVNEVAKLIMETRHWAVSKGHLDDVFAINGAMDKLATKIAEVLSPTGKFDLYTGLDVDQFLKDSGVHRE